MDKDQGWVKIYRRLFEHPIWLNSTPEQKVVLIVLIGMANHEPKKWEWNGKVFEVERGQMITSIESIKALCGNGVSTQNVRTALGRFKKLEFLTNESTKTGRLITIENYSKWQDVDAEPNKETNRRLTKASQRPNKDLTTNKNDKNDKNDKKRGASPVSRSELQNYIREKKLDVDADVFWNYYEENNWIKKNGQPVTDWKKSLSTWAARETKNKTETVKAQIEPPKYREFQTEPYEKDDFKSEQMPDEIRNSISKIFGGSR